MAATTTAEPRSLLFRCQACAAVLDLSGAPEDAAPSSSFSTATKLDPTRGGGSQTPVDTMDESFMVLPGSASGGHSGGSAGLPAWAKGGTVMTGGTGRGAGDGLAATNQKQASRPKKNTPESFVVLSNSVSRVASHGTDGGTEDTVAGLNARVAALARIFDLASDETSADHPMCLEVRVSHLPHSASAIRPIATTVYSYVLVPVTVVTVTMSQHGTLSNPGYTRGPTD